MTDDEPIEEHMQRRKMLLDGWLGMRALQLLHKCGDIERLYPGEIKQPTTFAPVREPECRFVVRPPRALVADGYREKFPEALSRLRVSQKYSGQLGVPRHKLQRRGEGYEGKGASSGGNLPKQSLDDFVQRLQLRESRWRKFVMILAHGPHAFCIVGRPLGIRVRGDVGQR